MNVSLSEGMLVDRCDSSDPLMTVDQGGLMNLCVHTSVSPK